MRFSTLVIIIALVGGGAFYAWRNGYFAQAQKAADRSSSLHYDKGESNYMTQQYAAAITEYETFIALEPGSSYVPRAYMRMGECYKELRQPEKAIEIYQKVLHDYPSFPQRAQVENALEKLRALGHY